MTKEQNFIEREKLLLDLEYNFICDLIRVRKSENLSQATLAKEAGIIRETIAKIENHLNSPQLNTLINILEPMGYTIGIIPLHKKTNGVHK